MQSNPFAVRLRHVSEDQQYGSLLSTQLGCESFDTSCLRSKSVSDILRAQGVTFWIPLPFTTTDELPFQPTIDGRVILGSPFELISKGIFHNVTIGLGTVRNDALSFIYGASPPISTWEYDVLIGTFCNPLLIKLRTLVSRRCVENYRQLSLCWI